MPGTSMQLEGETNAHCIEPSSRTGKAPEAVSCPSEAADMNSIAFGEVIAKPRLKFEKLELENSRRLIKWGDVHTCEYLR